MKRLFEIQTLSDNNRLGDPVTIITGGVSLLMGLFPNLFGAGKKLTMQDWYKILPGAGYWTTELRNHYYKTIHYPDHLDNMHQFSKYFVHNHQAEICSGMGLQNYPARYSSECFTRFLEILSEETRSGGHSPVGQTPGGFGATLDMNSLFLIGGGILLLMVIAKKKKK